MKQLHTFLFLSILPRRPHVKTPQTLRFRAFEGSVCSTAAVGNYRSSRKYALPNEAGGWFSRLWWILTVIKTTNVTT